MITNVAKVDLEVFRRYAGLSLPRHVSYPMPSWWHDLDAAEAESMRRQSHQNRPLRDLSLYLHIPFCEALCKFCACNRVVQRKEAPGADLRTEAYLTALQREIRRLAEEMESKRHLRQIHWGGGTPTYLSIDQVGRLQRTVEEAFSVSSDAEISIEIDPRVTTPEMLQTLVDLGFNRISMGVQDFNEQVQIHVHRVQSFEMVKEMVTICRDLGFDSINFDLIYGMPYQTPETIRDTVERTITLSPDRVAFYHYAQIPEKIATQRGIDHTKLPDSEAKLDMFLSGVRLFQQAGYELVGLDHFAKPDEGLAVASKDGTLQRNFQGMSTSGGLDLVGAGASSISHLLDIGFLQNIRDTEGYVRCIEEGKSPLRRGKGFSFDDRVRQAVINQLYCSTEIQPKAIEERFDITFADYFSRELQVIEKLERDGLVTVDPDNVVRLTFPLGRVLMRNVAAVFDAYLDDDAYRVGDRHLFSTNA